MIFRLVQVLQYQFAQSCSLDTSLPTMQVPNQTTNASNFELQTCQTRNSWTKTLSNNLNRTLQGMFPHHLSQPTPTFNQQDNYC